MQFWLDHETIDYRFNRIYRKILTVGSIDQIQTASKEQPNCLQIR